GGGGDGDGAQAGADRVSSVEARAALRAAEPGRVPGADEGEADQGVEAEGAAAGAGGQREAVGGRGHRGGAGAGGSEAQGGGRRVSRRGGERALPATRTSGCTGALSSLAEWWFLVTAERNARGTATTVTSAPTGHRCFGVGNFMVDDERHR